MGNTLYNLQAKVKIPLAFICNVSVLPLAKVNWLVVNCDRQSKCRLADAAAEIQITACLMFAIVPPVPVHTTSSASNL